MRELAVALLVLSMVATTESAAAEEPGGGDAREPPRERSAVPALSKVSISKHRLRAGATDLEYLATAEEIVLHDTEGAPTASFLTISYVASGVDRPEDRPVTFVFNGGPGSGSIWLHLGLVGPKLAHIPSDGSDPGSPPYHLEDNPGTILRITDLVFVDPVGTGYSHALGSKKDKDFWGFDEDADSVAELIRTFITTHDRWRSPKYLLGESYGGIRSAMLVPRLQQKLAIALNGVILVSPALNLGMLPSVLTGNDVAFATNLPALAATAYYHKRLPTIWPSQQALLAEVETYAGGEYLQALFKGDSLPKEEKAQVAARLHLYTGLSTDYILYSNLRLYPFRFVKELLRDRGQALGLLDSRYLQDELDDAAEVPEGDASIAKTRPIYTALFQSYLRNELGVDLERRYVGFNAEANESWKRPANGMDAFAGHVDVTRLLAQGTKDNGALRIFAATGYEDLATTYFATEYMLRHSGIDADRVTLKRYEGGHMMYLYQPSRAALSNDIAAFIQGH
jgi:carboxypeptidase C (cathepsin A)